MIKDKHIPLMATLSMILAVVLVVVTMGTQLQGTTKQVSLEQPDYMTSLFDKNKILEINIQIEESVWEGLKQNATDEEYVVADLTVNDETYSNIGIRAKGNSSLSMVASDSTTDRFSFKIKMDEYVEGQNIDGLDEFILNNNIGDATYMKEYLVYDMLTELGVPSPGFAYANIKINGEAWGLYLAVECLEEDFVERNFESLDGNLYKVESQNMNGGGQKGDMPQMENDKMARPQDIMGEPGIPTEVSTREVDRITERPKTSGGNIESGTQVSEELNGNVIPSMQSPEVPNGGMESGTLPPEIPDEQVISQVRPQMPGMSGSKGGANLVYTDDEITSYSAIFNYVQLKTTTEADYYKLIEAIKNLNEGTDLEKYFDVEEILKYFAVNTFTVNLDSYAGAMKHNFYLYEEDGKVQIIPWDFNLAFAAFEISTASKAINFPIDAPVTDSMENSPLISKLLEVDEYKALYHSYLQELISLYITDGKFEKIIGRIDALIGNYVAQDATAFYTYEEYQAALSELIQFGEDRSTSVLAQISGEQPSESYGTVETSVNLITMGTQNAGRGGNRGERQDGEFPKTDGKQNFQGGINQEMPGQPMMNTDSTSQSETIPNKLNQMAPRGDKSEGHPEGIQMSGGQANFDTSSIVEVAISLVSLLIGLVFVVKFKRKKIYSK